MWMWMSTHQHLALHSWPCTVCPAQLACTISLHSWPCTISPALALEPNQIVDKAALAGPNPANIPRSEVAAVLLSGRCNRPGRIGGADAGGLVRWDFTDSEPSDMGRTSYGSQSHDLAPLASHEVGRNRSCHHSVTSNTCCNCLIHLYFGEIALFKDENLYKGLFHYR